ncbi:60 kDa chaperonin [Candidatus Cyrtobacter comes]|uniref:Chaperonin GroEL n=1 Tax=Candidatus Cyrtobacter comes TaxID=675776 RepID=A0ABU5L8A7_9RICK|nr:chaperonin GroEL [Candidatus Cyrtobacter comes]MDZ5762277.1 60 kDa chaperonin [Candidatus Cyrtobacter comes]
MSRKKFLLGAAARSELFEGANIISKVVGSTLGSNGRNVIIERSFGAPKCTKDGVSVAKELEISDRFKNVAIQLIKEAANKANDAAGDGTTTCIVLAAAFVAAGARYANSDVNPMHLKRGIDAAVAAVVANLKKISESINYDDKRRVAEAATISSGDHIMGQKIAEAFAQVGKDGVITVQEATSNDEFSVKRVDGMSFDRGFIVPHFANSEKMTCELEKPYILLFDKKITTAQSILHILEEVSRSSRPLLIIAEDVEGEALSVLVVNKLRGVLKVAAVKAPGFGDRRKAMLEDISILTGGKLVSEEIGMKLEKITLKDLGSAAKVVITKDETTIVNGAGSESSIEMRRNQIKDQIEDSTSDYDKEKLQERLAKLSRGIAILEVGGITEAEIKEKKDRVEDAYNATKAAIAEGIVPGGGCALLRSTALIDDLKLENEDEEIGAQIVKRALFAPFRRILDNAGIDNIAVIEQELLKDNTKVFDARLRRYVDCNTCGIIDPTKVVRTALQSAASVASLILTSEAIIVEDDSDKKNASSGAPQMGGMGDMGGF